MLVAILVVWLLGLGLLVGCGRPTGREWIGALVLSFAWPFLLLSGIAISIAVMLRAKPSNERPISNHGWITKPD